MTFDASTSSDPDGKIVKYEWDLDGDGTYESTGTDPTTTHTYTAAGDVTAGVRVTDDGGATSTAIVTLHVTESDAGAGGTTR
ncbi:MAG: PKD domain-containing protein [Solirubrobacteraceae bacterium]